MCLFQKLSGIAVSVTLLNLTEWRQVFQKLGNIWIIIVLLSMGAKSLKKTDKLKKPILELSRVGTSYLSELLRLFRLLLSAQHKNKLDASI